jgi:hypothetical protein
MKRLVMKIHHQFSMSYKKLKERQKGNEKRCIVTLAIYSILIMFLSGAESVARTYTTNFPRTENPISEGGNWINGKLVGLDWNNVSTTPGLAIGHQPGNVHYTDGTALLKGSWGSNQTVQANVYVGATYSEDFPEVELRLRSSLSAHSCTGYEIAFKAHKDSSSYMTIARWNGPVGSFTVLTQLRGSQYGVANGDVVKATIIGNVITAYINGIQKARVIDATYTSGSPGIGFNYYCSGFCRGSRTAYGFTSFSATDGIATRKVPRRIKP